MDYHNQLVLTGEINDVGSAVMTNVKESYRAGIELVGVPGDNSPVAEVGPECHPEQQ